MLAGNDDLRLVDVVASTDSLTTALGSEKADILLLDLSSTLSFELLREVKRRFASCKVLLWVNGISSEMAIQSIKLGVHGIVRRTLPAETLLECLRKVGQGEQWFEQTLTDSLLSTRRVPLTRREGQLVTLLTQGLKNKEIASALGISENTVKVYLSRLFSKVGVMDRFELAIYGLRNFGLGRLDQSARIPQARMTQATPVIEGLRSPLVASPAQPRRSNQNDTFTRRVA